jgi:hypothetical protein
MKNRSSWIVAVLLAQVLLGAPARAGQGAAELNLDRAAVLGILNGVLARSTQIDVAGWGPVALRLRPATRVEFSEGRIVAVFALAVSRPDLETSILVRLAPEIDPVDGSLRFLPVELRPEPPLPFELDVAKWADAFVVPRRFDWSLAGGPGPGANIVGFVQGVKVEDERLVLNLGLSFRETSAHARP